MIKQYVIAYFDESLNSFQRSDVLPETFDKLEECQEFIKLNGDSEVYIPALFEWKLTPLT
jgi:hypothetical protein